MKSQLTATIQPNEMDRLWQIYSQNYQNTSKEEFLNDIKAKQKIFIGRDTGDQSIQGFSTLEIYKHTFQNKTYGVFYSGDTMILPDYWGQKALHFQFAKEFIFWKLKNPFTPLYWLLIVMGYKTYLIMAKNSIHYWPNYKTKTPDKIQELMHSLAKNKFGSCYHESTGVVRPQTSEVTFIHPKALFTQSVLKLPEVQFLNSKNPNHLKGEELVCLSHLNVFTFCNIFYRTLKKIVRKWNLLPLISKKTLKDIEQRH